MTERLQKIGIGIGMVLATGAIAFLLYWVFFRRVPSPLVTTVRPGPAGELPEAGGAKPFQPTERRGVGALPPSGADRVGTRGDQTGLEPDTQRTRVLTQTTTNALSPSPSRDGVRGYNPSDGKFYRILDDGTQIPLSEKTFAQVRSVTWANASDKSILTFPDGSNVLYDFGKDEQTTLPSHWEDFSFSPQDDRIAAKSVGNNPSNRFLVVANPDGSNTQAIEDLGANQDKVHVSWSPNNQIIAYAFTGEPIGSERQAIVLVGRNQENFPNLVVEGLGFIPNWSPSGASLLYSVYNSESGYRPTLWVSGASGDQINANRRSLSIQTWADKCAWKEESTLICAVPTTLGTGAGLQRALFQNIPDEIWQIDLITNQKTKLGQPEGSPSMGQITLTPDGNGVYFTDQTTGRLSRFDF